MSDTKRKEVCYIISEMLDNPDDCGIYGTTKAFESLGDLLDDHAAEKQQMCADAAVKTASVWKYPTGFKMALNYACLNATEGEKAL